MGNIRRKRHEKRGTTEFLQKESVEIIKQENNNIEIVEEVIEIVSEPATIEPETTILEKKQKIEEGWGYKKKLPKTKKKKIENEYF